jgi:CBS domain-containing protein
MPYPVKHLIQDRPTPVTVFREDTVVKALTLMTDHDFSQLPVIDLDKHPLGMVTYEGILKGIRYFRAKPEDLHVRDVMVAAPLSYLEDDLFELLEQLKQKNAVLIIDPDKILVGIVTSYDSTEYFRNRAENLMRVEDIEVMLKEFILLAYTLQDGSRDEPRLAEAISRVTVKDNSTSYKPKSFDDLTLGQYLSILVAKNTWSTFEPIFKIPRESLLPLLEDIRETRNILAHFRSEISSEQAGQLRYCADWLARCREEYEHLKAQETFNKLVDAYDRVKQQSTVVKDEASQYSTLPSDSSEIGSSVTDLSEDLRIIAEEKHEKESRYAPLADWLMNQPGKTDFVKITFDQIEAIIDGSLPASAYTHRSWWANDTLGHPQSQIWLEAGYRSTFINLTDRQVTFTRIREREKAYIDFFSKLIADLQKKTIAPLQQIYPDGTNWIVCYTISKPFSNVGIFVYSFARNKRFRVELYIDTNSQDTTKKVFDLIYAKKATIEENLGQVSWERIDDKRASRIALYHPGAITDSEEKLAAIRMWAVDRMITFHKVVEPIASRVIQEVLAG